MLKLLKVTIILNLLTTFSYAQTVTVVDGETGLPVEMTAVTTPGTNPILFTNSNGQVDLSSVAENDSITFSCLGYQSFTSVKSVLAKSNNQVALMYSRLGLNEVVISANRWNQQSTSIPSHIISISKKDMYLMNPQTAADLLGISGKVFIQKSQQGGGSPMIRGFATNRLLYSVDGVRMNTAIFRGGNIQNVINLDPFAIQNTEVVFGPGSVIYGSDAIGGVMSFQTLTPEFSLSDQPLITGSATTRYSSANSEKTEHFDIRIGWKKWAIATSISSWDFDHLRQGSNGPDDYLKSRYVQHQDSVDVTISQDDILLQIPSAYSQINLMQKIRFSPNKNWDFQYGFHFSETSSYGRYDRHNRVRNGMPRYAEWDYGPQKWMMHHLRIVHSAKSILYDELSINLAQQLFEESRVDRSLNRTERNTQTEEVSAFSINVDLKKSTGKRNQVFYGAEYVTNDVTSTGMLTDISTNISTNGPSRYPQSVWNSIGIYVNDEFTLNKKVVLNSGLRFNQYTLDADFDTTFYPFPFTNANINNSAITGSLGAVIRPAKDLVISVNLGTAFRSPNVDDLGKVFDSEPGAVTVPNPDLKAEYATNADLGIAKVFGNRIKVDVTGYYTILQNALVRRNYTLNGLDSILYQGEMSRVQAIQNAAKATVYGVQIGLEIKLGYGFWLSSDLNYQKGEEELDDESTSASRHAAPTFGLTKIGYRNHGLELIIYSAYQAEKSFDNLPQEEQSKDEIYAKDGNGKNYSPAWQTYNFKAVYQFTKHFSVSGGIENITDQRYRPYSSGISAAGRNVVFSVKANF
ncbi:MAG: TonB-dependent receptor plug domain-containing protein [Bacteroidetes bacterium]|nr:TonB-dependent receptor plug domain-containing protein [Bacteroidota bacterium]